MDDEIIIEAMIHNDNSNKKKKKKKNKNKKKNEFKSINKKTKKYSTKKAAANAASIYADKSSMKTKKKKRILTKKARNVVCTLLVIATIVLIFSSKLFYINNIEVLGNSKLTENEIISVSGVVKDVNIFSLNKLNAKRSLLENSYIEDVTITRVLPNTIRIEVEEKVPRYMIQFANSYIYINNQGYMLEISTEPLELPILLGITTDLNNVKPGDRLNIEDLNKFNKMIQIMDISRSFEMVELITKIDITDANNYTLHLEKEGKIVYLGDATDLNTKMLPLKGILEDTKGKTGEIFLDMDLNEQNARFKESY